MKLLDAPGAVTDTVHRLLQSVVADANWLEHSSIDSIGEQRWQKLINERLDAWSRNPEEVADEGVESPIPQILPLVKEVATALKDFGVDPPLRMVPNCEGGVQFEWRDPPFFWTIEVEATGLLTLAVFRDGHFVTRHQISQARQPWVMDLNRSLKMKSSLGAFRPVPTFLIPRQTRTRHRWHSGPTKTTPAA